MAGFTLGSNPATTTSGTSFTFGSNTSLAFGGGSATTATPGGGLTFGAPNANTSAIGGLGSAQPGFTFGSSTAPTVSTAGLSFGTGTGGLNFKGPTTTAVTTTSGFTFGVGQQQPAFGATPAATTTTTTSGLSFFNTPTPSAPQTTAITFGTTPQSSTTTGSGLFATPVTSQTSLSFAAPTQSTAAKPSLPNLSFGTPSTAASTTTTGLSFGFTNPAKTTTTTVFSLPTASTGSTGIFGFPSSTTVTSSATGVTTTATSVFKGLGGVDTSQSLTGTGGSGIGGGYGGRSESKTAKENQVPNDIIQCIENFKTFVKNQKNLSCEVARASVKPMAKVTEDTQALQQLLSSLASNVQKNNFLAERLKAETSKSFAQCEMSQRTHDTPAGLQNDNTAPLEFFMNLVAKFEHNVQVLRQEIDNTEKHVNTLSQPSTLAPQELSLALKRLHESFVALAGRLQVVHQTVVSQKERHLSLRRHFLKDATDIFSKPSGDNNRKYGIAAGPTPFSAMGRMQTLGIMATQDKTISSFPGGGGTMTGWGSTQSATPVPSIGGGSSLFNTGTSFSSTDNSNFQLLKPPPGNKRGKR
ncbi:nuclear pore complex protein Nup58 [Lycorma delicatula]|uniref:nuclear pore complex protein Nup58 n=1 Tax=Lycorma delicatula TaxID=130591 RepID=UPI003F5182AE